MGNLVMVINDTAATAADSCKLVVLLRTTAGIVEVIHIREAATDVELKAMLPVFAGVMTYLHQRFYQTFLY